jgi:hypothetical protein
MAMSPRNAARIGMGQVAFEAAKAVDLNAWMTPEWGEHTLGSARCRQWMRAADAVLEEAAKVAEAERCSADEQVHIAERIRALKTTPTDQSRRERPMSELKPCPFCGSPAAFKTRSNAYGTGASGMEAPDLLVACTNDKCPVRPETPGGPTEIYVSGMGYQSVKDDVTADQARRWNTRI